MFTTSISSTEVGIAVLLSLTVNTYNSGHDHRRTSQKRQEMKFKCKQDGSLENHGTIPFFPP